MKEPGGSIIVLMGRSASAREMAAMYVSAFGRAAVRIVEERPPAWAKLWKFLKVRTRNRGIVSAIDAILLRIAMMFLPGPSAKDIAPDLVVTSVNDAAVAAFVAREQPRFVILSICSLLSAEQIARIAAPIFNVHNGITPRYRGAGNTWAMAEANFKCIGATLHRVDAGVDTGEPVSIACFDPVSENIPFHVVDAEAFRRGAALAIDFVKYGRREMPFKTAVMPDRYYPFPGLTDWMRARRNFWRHRLKKTRDGVEGVWQTSFKKRAADQSLPVHERLHWSDGSSVGWRDAAMLEAARGACHQTVLDVGCGDARLASKFGDAIYVGADFSEQTLRLAPTGTRLVAAGAGALPFAGGTFDLTLASGLLQHLEDAQAAADELWRVTGPGGVVVVNTLRQYSRLELAVIAVASLFSPQRLALVGAIWQRKHGLTRTGALVARRYTLGELRRLWPRNAKLLSLTYHGPLPGPLFAREITMSFRVEPLRRGKRLDRNDGGQG